MDPAYPQKCCKLQISLKTNNQNIKPTVNKNRQSWQKMLWFARLPPPTHHFLRLLFQRPRYFPRASKSPTSSRDNGLTKHRQWESYSLKLLTMLHHVVDILDCPSCLMLFFANSVNLQTKEGIEQERWLFMILPHIFHRNCFWISKKSAIIPLGKKAARRRGKKQKKRVSLRGQALKRASLQELLVSQPRFDWNRCRLPRPALLGGEMFTVRKDGY